MEKLQRCSKESDLEDSVIHFDVVCKCSGRFPCVVVEGCFLSNNNMEVRRSWSLEIKGALRGARLNASECHRFAVENRTIFSDIEPFPAAGNQRPPDDFPNIILTWTTLE